jgi:cytochrome c-type biogenesis protein CcmH/NrfG
MEEDLQKQILDELQKQTIMFKRATRTNLIIISAFLILVAISVVARPFVERIAATPTASFQRPDSWYEVRNLQDQGDTQKAEEMVTRLIKKRPDFYYGYILLGSTQLELGKIKDAENSYAKAYELLPSEDNEKALAAIRKVVADKKETADKRAEQSR